MGDNLLSITVTAVLHIIPCEVVFLQLYQETVHLVVSLELLGNCLIIAVVFVDLWNMSSRGRSQGPLFFSTQPASTGILLEDSSYVEKGKVKDCHHDHTRCYLGYFIFFKHYY